MSPTSTLVICPIDHSASQYLKDLKQNQGKKTVKIIKAMKIIIKARKLKSIAKTAYFLVFLSFFYYLSYFSKKLYLSNKNL